MSEAERQARSERMTQQNADPEFRAKATEAASEWMTRQWQDSPEFAAKSVAASTERITHQWQDNPEFRAKQAAATREPAFRETARETMTRLRSNPAFVAKQVAGASRAMTRNWENPEFVAANSERTKQRWAEYRALKAEAQSQGNALPANLQRYGRPRSHHSAVSSETPQRPHQAQQNADPAFRAKATEAAKEMTHQWQNPELRATMLHHPHSHPASPEQRETARETMTRLNKDPAFAMKRDAAGRETLTRLNNDPSFALKRDAAASERMTRLNDDPTFRAETSERMKRRWIEYRARKAELTATAGNANTSAVSSETPQRQHRARGIKLARTLTPE